jgi:superfamily II DNA or RNA helicase
MAGLERQGELNVDVLEQDAAAKLQKWFNDRWNDQWCLDISDELAEIVESSWARAAALPPYYIYLKIAYHLSQEARAGLAEFGIPRDFGNELFEFQKAAVKIAAHHLNKRGGVLIGDVVGLGKTLMASALARIYQDDYNVETLIISPKNLVKMWQDYVDRYRLIAKVLSLSRVLTELPAMRRYRLVLIDESQNLRNREGKTYRAIQEYIAKNDSKCILLSATPYNKTYLDLSNQLRLFVEDDADLGIRPEHILAAIGETEFIRQWQAPLRSLAAFEKSEFADDWRELMRLYMVRRTRSFIEDNYAQGPDETGRKFLVLQDGTKFHFPKRLPRTVKFQINARDSRDTYARLYSDAVVTGIGSLHLPRYGLGNYVRSSPDRPPTPVEAKVLQGLSRAGKRLMGFCRTNLFKRLESSGNAFLLSVERHVLRNFVVLHAIENNLAIPLGPQSAALLDPGAQDEDAELALLSPDDEEDGEGSTEPETEEPAIAGEEAFRRRAAQIYASYRAKQGKGFHWLSPHLFTPKLKEHLLSDARTLLKVLADAGTWSPTLDAKLNALEDLVTRRHPKEKVLIFTQFADTARYLGEQLAKRRVDRVEWVTGQSDDPTSAAWRFSPVSNKRDEIKPGDQVRVLVATDVLSDGQNLQDAAIVVNFDLPWALVRLVQRAGRVDRIGQKAPDIYCYSFLPADGVERIIRLRGRVRQRLVENAEVVGGDEAFFEDDVTAGTTLGDIYNEKAGVLDGETDNDVDLGSYAYQIWKNAIDRDPKLVSIIPELPNVVYSSRSHAGSAEGPEGVLVYVRTASDNDALAWVDRDGGQVTQSQLAILRAAECDPETPAVPRHPSHHDLVEQVTKRIATEEKSVGGQLGRPSGARFKTYERLQRHANRVKGTLFETKELLAAIDDVHGYPLKQSAVDTLNRQLRSGVTDDELADLVMALRADDQLCVIQEQDAVREPQIVCSMGLVLAEQR